MAENHDPKKSIRAHGVLKQQIAAVEAALSGRPLRIPVDAWKRGGGVPGKTTSDLTHYESAYRNALAGRDRALAGKGITAEQEESHWFRFAYWTTLTLLDLIGTSSTEAVAARKPEATAVKATDARGGKVEKPALKLTPKPFAKPASEPAIQPDSDWFNTSQPEGTLGHVMPIVIAALGSVEIGDEPIACPTNVSDKVKKTWKIITQAMCGLTGDAIPSRHPLAASVRDYAKREDLAAMLTWDHREQKFEFTETAKKLIAEQ